MARAQSHEQVDGVNPQGSCVAAEGLKNWDGQSLGAFLSREGQRGGLWSLQGMGREQLYALTGPLRSALHERGVVLLLLDPTGAFCEQQTLSSVMERYVREVGRRGELTPEIEELVGWLHAMRADLAPRATRQQSVITDALCRLWMALGEKVPAVLLVFSPERVAEQVARQLEYLSRYYFEDPIEQISPEFGSMERARGALVAVMPGGGTPEWWQEVTPGVLDATLHLEESVRAYLSREDVVRKLIETTHGDMRRLEDLLENAEENIEHLWARRFDALDEASAVLISLLATCRGAVEMSLAHRAMASMGHGKRFTVALKQMLADGLIERAVQTGEVLLALKDRPFGDMILARMPAEELRGLNHTWMRAAVEAEDGREHAVFVARHALASQDYETAVRYGMRASRALFRRGLLEEASGILSALLPYVDAEIERAEMAAMQVDIHARMGMWRAALMACQELDGLVAGLRGRAELANRRAGLMMKLGQHEEAIELLTQAEAEIQGHESLMGLSARMRIERGDAYHKRGDHKRAMLDVQGALETLDACLEQNLVSESEGQEIRVRGQNVLGILCLYQTDYDKAEALFHANLELSELWGWRVDAAYAALNLGVVALQRRQLERAHKFLLQAQETARGLDPRVRIYGYSNLAVYHQLRFEYEAAIRHYLETMRLAQQVQDDMKYASAAMNLALLYTSLGAHERAGSLVEHLRQDDAPIRSDFVQRWLHNVELKLEIERDELARAEVVASRSGDEDDNALLYGGREAVLLRAQVLLGLGRTEMAREMIHALEEKDAGSAEPLTLAREQMIRARLAIIDDDEQAISMAQRAAELFLCHGDFVEATRARHVWAHALESRGRVEEAKGLLDQVMRDVLEHAEFVPMSLRDAFFEMPLHDQIARMARRLGCATPDVLGRSRTRRTGEQVVVTHDAAWQAWRAHYSNIVGESPRLHQMFRVIDRIAPSSTTVLLLGESGTGKELFAEAIHARSERAQGPMIKVNCAAFVDSLLLSELFGHEKGAFTGAVAQKRGRFELADGGTLFLDEIADISLQTQVALLRVLQEGTFERVGGTETRKVDVRVVCATNKNLEEMVQEGTFRLDLYYRLKGMVLELPALRERREDIPRLVDAFASRFSPSGVRFDYDAARYLMSYSWPGNIRELQNFVRSVLLFVVGERVTMEEIREFLDFFQGGSFAAISEADARSWYDAVYTTASPGLDESISDATLQKTDVLEEQGETLVPFQDPQDALIERILSREISLVDVKRELEVAAIRRAIVDARGNVTQAAKLLQMKRPRLSQIINGDPELSELKANAAS